MAKRKQLYEILEQLPDPTPEMELNDEQKKWWYWFGQEFLATKKLRRVDLVHLHSAAIWMDARCQALKEINANGYYGGFVQKFQSGATNVSGHVSVLKQADKQLADVSSHFGMSIKDREKLSKVTEEETEEVSVLEKWIKEKAK